MFRTSEKNKSICARCDQLGKDQITQNHYNKYQTCTSVIKRQNRYRIETSLYNFYKDKKDLYTFKPNVLICSACYEQFSKIINS